MNKMIAIVVGIFVVACMIFLTPSHQVMPTKPQPDSGDMYRMMVNAHIIPKAPQD